MCNAYNHPIDCTCGWGGEGHLGKSPGGGHHTDNIQTVNLPPLLPAYRSLGYYKYGWRYERENWCKPILCDRCGSPIYLIRHNGGYVSFDSLGKPWPKHPCYDIPRNLGYYDHESSVDNPVSSFEIDPRQFNSFTDLNNVLIGLIIQVEFLPKSKSRRVVIQWSNQETSRCILREAEVNNFIGLTVLIGEIVVVSKLDLQMACIGLKVNLPFHEEPIYAVGNWYKHDTFGSGQLLAVEKQKGDYRLIINFNNLGEKTLMAGYANLAID